MMYHGKGVLQGGAGIVGIIKTPPSSPEEGVQDVRSIIKSQWKSSEPKKGPKKGVLVIGTLKVLR